MRRLVRPMISAVFVLSVSSCASLERVLTQIAASEWATVNTDYLTSGAVVLEIHDGIIWQPGDDAEELRWHIFQNLRITADGEPVPDDIPFMLTQFEVPIEEYDAENNVIGTHFKSTFFYILSLNRPNGAHVLTVETTSTSGRVYSRSWDFEINR